jgi:hypothetical protein
MGSLGAILAIWLGVLGAAGARPAAAPEHHSYTVEKIWQTRLGYYDRADFAVCPDGRTYVITKSQRLVVLDAEGAYLDREQRVPELVHAQAAACGPDDLLYLAGSRFAVVEWSGPKAISLVSYASLPLLVVDHLAAASSGEALVEGLARPGGSRLYLVRQDGSLIAGIGGSNDKLPMWKRSREAFRYSLAYDARGRRFVEVPWDEYEFRTFGLRGKALGTFERNDPSFGPGAMRASPMGMPFAGDEVRSVVVLPDGRFLTQVVKQGARYVRTYWEIFDRSFHLVGRTDVLEGMPYGVVRGADKAGDLYFGYDDRKAGLGVVKARLVKR